MEQCKDLGPEGAFTCLDHDPAVHAPLEYEHVPDETVERVVLRLRAICRRATVEFAVTVGRLIVDEFYGGDVNLFRTRSAKSHSFRKLAKHPRLPMSPASLYRSVAIFELCERFGLEQWSHVSITHMRLVLGLPSDLQRRLLEAAEASVWPVRRLELEVALLKHHSAARGGHPSRPPLRKTIRTLERCLDQRCGLIGADDPNLDLSPESARAIAAVLHSVKEACLELENRMARRQSR